MTGGFGRGECVAARVQAVLLLAAAWLCANSAAADPPFYMGADISLETFMQQQNVTFTDGGVAKPLDTLMYDRGANLFRLRVFVNPQTTYTNTNAGAIQNQAYDIALAQQIKAHAPYAKLLLDFHYSDTWADPGHQTKPSAWNGLTTAQLQAQVQSYTHDTIAAFNAAGVTPDMVQVGNEISSGMLWNTGKLSFGALSTWQPLGSLLNSAIQGVRTAQPEGKKIDIAIHIDAGDQDGHPQYYFGNLTNPGGGNVSDFDTIGVSYYPSTRSFYGLNYLQNNLTAMANTYPGKKIMVLETNYSWTPTPTISDVGVPDWTESPAGQQDFMEDLQNVLLNLPNHAGAGIVYWYPEAVQVAGYNIYHGGATALFDGNRAALPAISTFGITLVPGDYNRDGTVDAADYTVWRDTFGATSNLSANGDNTGASENVVDQADYDYWLAHVGAHAGSGGGVGGATVPEPATIVLVFTGLLAVLSRRRAVPM